MKVLKTIELDGKLLSVVQYHGGSAGRMIKIHGQGADASLSLKQASELYGALRTLDSEGLLEG